MTTGYSGNDMRVMRAAVDALKYFDGLMPHGSADWIALRRLVARGHAECIGDGVCETCPDAHDGQLFRLTDAGRRALGTETAR